MARPWSFSFRAPPPRGRFHPTPRDTPTSPELPLSFRRRGTHSAIRFRGWARNPASTPGVLAPSTHSSETDPVHPGFSRPGTFRPQGLSTLPAVCSLLAHDDVAKVRRPGSSMRGFTHIRTACAAACRSRLLTVRRPPSVHGVFPSGSCSSRPAVPLSGPRLSWHSPASPACTPPEGEGPGRHATDVTPEVSPLCAWSRIPAFALTSKTHSANSVSCWTRGTAGKGNEPPCGPIAPTA